MNEQLNTAVIEAEEPTTDLVEETFVEDELDDLLVEELPAFSLALLQGCGDY